jgi:opacity protein-like surface antigen
VKPVDKADWGKRLKYLFALGLLIVVPVSAQTTPQAIEISPFAGYLFGGSLSHSLDPDPHLSVADRLDYGLRIGFNVTPHVEPEIQWTRTETDVTGTGTPVSLDINYLVAGVSYNFCAGNIRPYVTLGVGAALLKSSARLRESSATNFAATAGVGVKAFLTPNIGVRLEGRGYVSELPGAYFPITCSSNPGGAGGPIVPVPCINGWLLNGDLTGGLIFAF